MGLQKLTIKNVDKDEEIPVLFNPTTYSIDCSNSWEEQRRDRGIPEYHFKGLGLRKLSMELFLDTYEGKEDVRTHTRKLANLLVASDREGGDKRPPMCQLVWGNPELDPTNAEMQTKWVLETLKLEYTLFLDTGTPVRAKATVSFGEYRAPKNYDKSNPKSSSLPARAYLLKHGDRLSSISGKLLKDPKKWRVIAEANNIDNPRKLEPGQLLKIPYVP